MQTEVNNKLISVIIPVRNGINYLTEAVEGIRRQGMNVEIIAVDDYSSDGTAELAEKLGCICIRNSKNCGQAASKNKGLGIAKGEYIMFHDHDDVMNVGGLRELYGALEKEEDLMLVMARLKDFVLPDLSDAEKAQVIIKEQPYHGLFTGAILMRKELFDIVGELDGSIHTGELIDLIFKINKLGLKTSRIDFVSCNRRIHGSNFGRTSKITEFTNYSAILRRKLAKAI